MKLLLGVLGTLLVVVGAVAAVGALFGTVYDKSSYDNAIECVNNVPNSTTSCHFVTNPSSAAHDFTQAEVMAIVGGAGMVTGGCLIAGACALTGHARRESPTYAGPSSGGFPPPQPQR